MGATGDRRPDACSEDPVFLLNPLVLIKKQPLNADNDNEIYL